MNPSYIAGQATGNRIGQAFQNIQDKTALDSILENAANSNDPNAITDTMSKILNQVKDPQKRQEAIKILDYKYKGLLEQKKQQRTEQNSRQNLEALGKARNVDVSGFTDPKLAEQATRQKNLPGGVSNLPVTEEESSAIERVINENKNANSDQLAIAFAKAKIPPRLSNPYIENRRRQDETVAKTTLDYHKESAKYDDELLKNIKTAKKQIETVGDIEKVIQSGNVKPSSWSNIFKGLGNPITDKIGEALLNGDEATLQASIPALLEGWKEVFGVRLSDADLKVLQDKLPSIGKSPAANKAILNILKKYGKQTLLRGQISKEIKDKNKGLRPLDYAQQIETRYDEMIAPVKIINPTNGRTIEIPAYELSDAILGGAKLANEQL